MIYKPRIGILDYIRTSLALGNKTGGKMTLTVDAAGAAVNSSIATVSVKRLKPRFWPPFCDREYFCFSL